MKKYTGLYTALVTPFDINGNINADALQKLTAVNMGQGVDGFYVSGSTGESYLLSVRERKYLIDAVTEAAGGKADVIVNIGMFATEHSIELAKYAEKRKVSALSSVPPFYFPFSKEELTQYYFNLAEATELPVIVYNIPKMSGVDFSTEDLYGLLNHEKIIGIKHTSYDLFQMQQLIQKYPQKSIFIGHDEIYLSALSVGAKAGIGSTYNIMAGKFTEMKRCFAENRMDEALAIQGQANNVIAALCKVGVFKGVKAILKMQGIDCGTCRKPFMELDKIQLEYLEKIAGENGILQRKGKK